MVCGCTTGLPAELPRGAGDDAAARRRGVPRNHPTMVRQVRANLRQRLRHRRPRPGNQWHLDEVFLTINGQRQYLWRAVDQDGNVLDILVTSRRDTKAATRVFRKLLKCLEYVPRVVVTDKLGSYQAARRTVLSSVDHRQSKYLNNRAKNVRHEVARNEWITLTGGRYRSAA
jgi:putative transposase